MPYGIFICLECAALHRHLGTHLSFVRSTGLDSWTERQMSFMRVGGNQKARAFFRKHGFDSTGQVDKAMLSVKYESRPAQLYRKEIQDAAETPDKKDDSFLAGYKQQAEKSLVDHEKREEEHKDDAGFHIEKKQSDGPRILDFGGKADGKKKGKLGAAVKASAFDDWDDEDDGDNGDDDAAEEAPSKAVEEESIYSKGRPAALASGTSSTSSSRLAYHDDEAPSGYSKPRAKEEPKQPEILFSEEGFRLKRKPEAENKKKEEESRFASSKAISSDEYFGRKETTDPEVAARLAKFSGSSSISSADFYERDEGFSNDGGGGGGDDLAINIAATAKEDLEKLTKTVTAGLSTIASYGSAFFSSLSDPNSKYGSGSGW